MNATNEHEDDFWHDPLALWYADAICILPSSSYCSSSDYHSLPDSDLESESVVETLARAEHKQTHAQDGRFYELCTGIQLCALFERM